MVIRLWKLGSVEQQIYPSQATLVNFQEMISNMRRPKVEVIDFVCGPDLTVEQFTVNDDEIDIPCREFALTPEGIVRIQQFVQSIAEEMHTECTCTINQLMAAGCNCGATHD